MRIIPEFSLTTNRMRPIIGSSLFVSDSTNCMASTSVSWQLGASCDANSTRALNILIQSPLQKKKDKKNEAILQEFNTI